MDLRVDILGTLGAFPVPDLGVGPPDRLEEASQEFEAILLGYMLRAMRATIPESGLVAKGSARRLYEGMLDEQLARHLARAGALGLGRMLMQELAGSGAGAAAETASPEPAGGAPGGEEPAAHT